MSWDQRPRSARDEVLVCCPFPVPRFPFPFRLSLLTYSAPRSPFLTSSNSLPALPSDWLFAIFNILCALAWLPFAGSVGYVPMLVAAHLIAASLPFLLDGRPLSRGTAWLRQLYPLLWIGGLWNELDLHSALIDTTRHDALVARLDRAIFGVHLHLVWVERMPWPWLSEFMQAAYFAYYPLLIAVPLLIVARGDRSAIREMWLRVVLTYLVCYTIYLFYPVSGPDGDLPFTFHHLISGPIYRLNRMICGSGDSLGTSLPSSHVAATVALSWLAWQYLPRWHAILATIVTALICLATVYTQQHFAIDSLAGLIVSLVLQVAVTAVGRHRGAPHPERA